jgi:cytochrome P450
MSSTAPRAEAQPDVSARLRTTALVTGRVVDSSVRSLRRTTTSAVRRRRSPVTGIPLTRADPFDRALLRAPACWWQELHQEGPLHRSRERNVWIISGHAEVREAAQAHDALSSADGILAIPTRLPILLAMDRPDHTRLRRLLARDFTKRALDELRPRIEQFAATCLDEMLYTHPAEARGQLAGPLPISVIADVLGIPDDRRADFRTWSDDVVKGAAISSLRDAMAFSPRVVRSAVALLGYFDGHVRERRRRPQDDILSRLVTSREEGGLTDAELQWFVVLLLVAGNETTTSLISALLHAFAADPVQYERLRNDPTLVPAAIDEGLRWGSPIRAVFRTTTRPYEVAGRTIPAQERVMLLIAAANRDPRRYEDPDEFRIDRDATDHVGFGLGIHYCLGAHLARLETQVVLEQMLPRVAAVLPAGEPHWAANLTLHGLERLPVELVPAG